MSDALLTIDHLSVDYRVGAGTFHALRDLSLRVDRGEVVGIVGETGCGKSTLAHAIPRLLPEPPARIVGGEVTFDGVDIGRMPKWKLPSVRGTEIGMIFQEPINSLNPAYRILDQLAESIRLRRRRAAGAPDGPVRSAGGPFDYSSPPRPGAAEGWRRSLLPSAPSGTGRRRSAGSAASIRAEALELLRLVRINDPETILGLYPHELSGGMRQRVMIAMTLAQRPALLIADEPTSALDVTIQAQVLTLMKELLEEIRTSILFISHDLGVIAEIADRVGVMYAGALVEIGPVAEIFSAPRHPYTRALLRAAPDRYKTDGPLPALSGSVPNLSRLPSGCAFHPRCPRAQSRCAEPPAPPLEPKGDGEGHTVACHFPVLETDVP